MEYIKRPMLLPKEHASRFMFGDLSREEIDTLSTELTEQEKTYPHAKYLRSKVPLSPIHQKVIDDGLPMDPVNGFEMRDYGKYMNRPGYCEVENGYCVLPSGVTYAAMCLKQPGRTDEMVQYYNEHFAPEEGLFYKIWCPGNHYLHYVNGCIEDFGFGRLNMKFVGSVQVEDLGLDCDAIAQNDPNCIAICGSTTIGYNLDSNHPDRLERNTIVFYHRETPEGRELRVRLWYGIGVENHEYLTTTPNAAEAEKIARCTFIHLAKEYTNDEYLERTFWNDTHPSESN